MNKRRYNELKRKDELTEAEYLEIMSYEDPNTFDNLTNLINNWDTMDEDEIEKRAKDLSPQDWELVQEQIDHASGSDWD